MCESSSLFFFLISFYILISETNSDLYRFFVRNKKLFSVRQTFILVTIYIKINRVMSFNFRSNPIGYARFPSFISFQSLRRFTVEFVCTNCRLNSPNHYYRLHRSTFREMRSPEESVSAIRGESETTLGVRSG